MAYQNNNKDKPNGETLALLKILALGDRQIVEGKVKPAAEAIKILRQKIAER